MRKIVPPLIALLAGPGSACGALVAHYSFDNAANLGADSQGFANGTLEGTPSVTAFTDPERGAVVELTGGATGYIHAPIGTLPGGGFTISVWVKSDSWAGNRGVFQVQNGGGATVSSTTKVIGAWISNTGIPWGRVIDSTGAKTMPTTGPTLTTGASAEWHHLAYRGNGTTYEVFIDGSNVGTTSIGYNGTLAAHDTIIIGRQGNEAWDGLLDDLQIYNNALSNSEILALATVPEPSAVLLLGGSFVLLLRRRARA